MASFKQILKEVLKWEGGYSNNPLDFGQETYKGISRRYNPDWKGWYIIDHEKSVRTLKNNDFIQNSTLEELVETLYKENYWNKIWGFKIKKTSKAFMLFDSYVNQGANGLKIAQRVLNEIGFNLVVDGVMGNNTLTAINEVSEQEFLENFTDARAKAYQNLNQPHFLQGWLNRTEDVLATALDYSKKKSCCCCGSCYRL